MTRTVLTAVLTTGLIAGSAHAALIQGSSNADNGGNAANVNAQIDTDAMIGPLGGGPNQTWNIITQDGSGNVTAGLLDSTGAPTGVGFETTQTERRGVTGAIGLEVARTFFQFFGKGSDATITFSGLNPGDLYNVALVSVSNSSGGTEDSIGEFSTANATTSASVQAIDGSTRNTDTFVLGQNYVLFENVVVDGSGEIVFLADAADIGEFDSNAYRLQLNAFQLELVPEPSSLALLGLGGLMIARRRRG